MELIIQVGFNNGQVSLKCSTFDEANAARAWLVSQGMLPALAGDVPEAPPTDDSAARAAAEAAIAAAEKEQPKAAKSKSVAKREAVQKAPAEQITATIQDVTKAVTDYAAAQGPTEARALFSRFGVTRGGDLKPEQFADFIATAVDYTARGVKASEAQLPEGSETVDELM